MAIAFDAASSVQAVAASTVSWSHTCTGDDRLLFASVGGESFGLTYTATYNSVAMTELWDVLLASFYGHAGYYLVAPASGANTVAITASGTADRVWGLASSYTGVDQTTPVGTAATDTGTSTTPSVAVGSADGDLVVDSVTSVNTTSLTVGTGQTQRENQASSTSRGLSEEPAAGASVTMSWTTGGSAAWHIGGVALKAAVAGGGGTILPQVMAHYYG